jgi:hypothetical protein
MLMSQTLKEKIIELQSIKITHVKGDKVKNNYYITLNTEIAKLITELKKMDEHMLTPKEFV